MNQNQMTKETMWAVIIMGGTRSENNDMHGRTNSRSVAFDIDCDADGHGDPRTRLRVPDAKLAAGGCRDLVGA